MAHATDPIARNRLARGVGLALLIAFGLGVYQMSSMGDDTLIDAAAKGSVEFSRSLRGQSQYDAIEIVVTILTAIGFYLLVRPINAALSLLAAALRLVSAGLSAVGVYTGFDLTRAPEQFNDGDNRTAAATTIGELNFDLFHWGLIASSIAAAITFALLFRARFMPRIIAGYGVVASLATIVGASSIYLAPGLSELMFPAYAAANALAFLSLALWLVAFGVDTKHWNER